MKVIRADESHKKQVLELLDAFRTVCAGIINPEIKMVSTTAKEFGGVVFDKIINSESSAIFLAEENNKFIGIATINKIPQIRWGRYCAEIEEMFVIPEFQGKGTALLLMDAMVNWAKENKIKCIRLETGNELKRAHGFYEKNGFRFYGRAYERIL